jgi:hypothetical protein
MIVGTSGKKVERFVPPTAIAFNLFYLIKAKYAGGVSNVNEISPLINAGTICAVPLYGTCVILTSDICLNISPLR